MRRYIDRRAMPPWVAHHHACAMCAAALHVDDQDLDVIASHLCPVGAPLFAAHVAETRALADELFGGKPSPVDDA